MVAPEGDGISALPGEDPRAEQGECSCCGGVGEHKDGHECYVCDASGTARAQGDASNVCEGHHGRPDDGPGSAKERYGPGYVHASALSGGYEGVTVAGILVVARDTGAMLLAQRAYDEDDDPEVRETWEMPGGHLEDGEDPLAGALREFTEEVGAAVPDGEVVHGWRAGDADQYQGFVYAVDRQFEVDEADADPEEVQAVGWFTPEQAATLSLRPEFATNDLAALVAHAVSGNEGDMDDSDLSGIRDLVSTEPVLTALDLVDEVIPVHGVIAPEEVPTGDGRGFEAGSMTSRPLPIPFRWQRQDLGGHTGASLIGSVDRMMRKDGVIHWEGSLMPTTDAADFLDVLAFFGKFGVSVDGDKGGLNSERSQAEGITWFDAIRAAGLTAVDIPAFAEAYVALGPHPDMPKSDEPEALAASGVGADDIVGVRRTFDRGPGWITNPKETKRLHDYWTKPGQPGYQKIRWGVGGDYRRCVALVGEKIAKNSPEDMRYIKRICAQWHHDALGYWPGELGKPGNNPKRAALLTAVEKVEREDIAATDDGWEAVLVSSAGKIVKPPLTYFHRPDELDDPNFGALKILDPDENGVVRTFGYAAEWGVCHIGYANQCVEPPRTYSDDYPEFHLGITRTEEGDVPTGVLTYGVDHRDAETILRETPEQSYFDNINNAWASVRVGEDDRGVWFSGVVLPGVPSEHLVKIQASGQVSGEWKYGAMRACLTVNVPGYPVQRPSVEYDEDGNVLALAASAFSFVDNGVADSPCHVDEDGLTYEERFQALRRIYIEEQAERAKDRFQKLREGRSV